MSLELRSGEFRLGGRAYPADFGTLRTPRRFGGGEVELPLLRLRCAGPRPAEPVLILSGGPGTPNVYPARRLAEWGLELPPFHWLLERHDLVAVGYRGAEGRPRLDCPEIARFLAGEPRLLETDQLRRLGGLWKGCRRELTGLGIDFRDFTIVEVVDDLEAARRALGYGPVNLLAASYGSRLAWLYARRHPDSLRRMLLYGVNPPGHFRWSAAEVEAVLRRHAELWRDAGRRPADLLALLGENLAGPLTGRDGVVLDRSRLRLALFRSLFGVREAVAAFNAFVDAAGGDFSGLARLCAGWGRRDIAWGELAAKGLSADHEPSRDYLGEFDPPDSLIGSPLALLYWAPVQLAGLEVETIDEEWRRHGPIETPTLCLSGGLDVATPPHWVDELLPHLRRGAHLVVEGSAHCGDLERLQPDAFAEVVSAFLAEGRIVEDAFKPLPVDYAPDIKPA